MDALDRGDAGSALALYGGDFLAGFHLDDVAGLDHWVAVERDRIQTVVCAAAGEASRAAERAGDLAAAASLARRACELSPYAESGMLELMRLLDAQGNRADALIEYEAFAKRLREELEIGASPALVAAAERIREGRPAALEAAPPARPARSVAETASVPPARAQPAGDIARDAVTTASAMRTPAPTLLDETAMFEKALGTYAVAFIAVAILAKVAISLIGLPDWVFPGALIVMALGLPVVLWTGYVYRVTRRAVMMTPASTSGASGHATAHGAMESLALKTAPRLSWFRTARGGMFALAAFVVVVAAFMAMRAYGIGPAGSLLAAGKLKRTDPLLLDDFRVTNADAALGRVASDAVRQALSESAVITLVPPAAVAAALRRAERPPTAQLDVPLARDLAIRQGIKAIIDGEVDGVAGGYLVTLRLIGVDSLAPLATLIATGQGPQGFIDAMDRVTRAFRAKMGESLRRVRSTPPLSDVTTGSLDALRKYSAALQANNVGDYPKAVALAREATSLDTGFAMAWIRLAGYIGNASVLARRSSAGSVDSAYSRAYAQRARLDTLERLRLIGLSRRYDRPHKIAALQATLSLGHAADSADALMMLGRWSATRQDFARADSFMVLSLRADPNDYNTYVNRVWWLFSGGRLAEAREAANLLAKRFPANAFAQTVVRDMLWHEGRLDELRRQVDSVDASGNQAMKRGWVVPTRMYLAVREGRLAEWWRLRMQIHDADSASGLPADLAGAALSTSVAAEVRGPGPRAAEVMDAALRQRPLKSLPDVERPYFAIAGRVREGRRAGPGAKRAR